MKSITSKISVITLSLLACTSTFGFCNQDMFCDIAVDDRDGFLQCLDGVAPVGALSNALEDSDCNPARSTRSCAVYEIVKGVLECKKNPVKKAEDPFNVKSEKQCMANYNDPTFCYSCNDGFCGVDCDPCPD